MAETYLNHGSTKEQIISLMLKHVAINQAGYNPIYVNLKTEKKTRFTGKTSFQNFWDLPDKS